MYIKQLVASGEIVAKEADGFIVKNFNSQLQKALDTTREMQEKPFGLTSSSNIMGPLIVAKPLASGL